MKIPENIKSFLLHGVCTSTSLKEAVRMVAVLEVIFALGFMCHGSYLCAPGLSDDTWFGILYLFSGITYWTLTWLLWMASEKPTVLRCRTWIFASILNQLLIIVLTVTRNVLRHKIIWSANIWIICALFLQCYMIGVVWAFMLDFQHNRFNESKHNLSSWQATGNERTSISSTLNSDNDKNSVVVSL